MTRSKTSKKWLKEHFDDTYVKKAKADGWRSRAAYKLLEIQQKDHIIKPGYRVLDLGAAPGGWSQVAINLVGDKGQVLASDILPMDPIPGVEFIEGDFTEDQVYNALVAALEGKALHLVISDMAPNMSGMKVVDQPKSMYLAELALDMARQVLAPKGDFLVKVFQGEGIDEYRQSLKADFAQLITRKPDASRARSTELYLLAKGFKGG